MKIEVEFELKKSFDEKDRKEIFSNFVEFLSYLDLDDLEQWTINKYPKRYKNIVEDYV